MARHSLRMIVSFGY